MDVDLLVTAEGLAEAHDKLEGSGYLSPFGGSKHLVDTVSKVRVKFLVAGQYPGDGKPKEAFPDPSGQAVEIDGIKVLNLPKLIDLKLASGMSNPRRLQDIVDVQRLIEKLHLSIDFTEQIAPSVREKFRELHQIVTEVPDPYNDEAD